MTRHHSCRVSPFGHPRINARLTAPRGISQPPTSFIGSQCQGIHHAPLNTYNTKPKMSFKRNCTSTHNRPKGLLRARCSQPLSTNQTPHPTTKDGATTRLPPHAGAREKTGLLSQSPTVCLAATTGRSPPAVTLLVVHQTRRHYSAQIPHGSHPPNGNVSRGAP